MVRGFIRCGSRATQIAALILAVVGLVATLATPEIRSVIGVVWRTLSEAPDWSLAALLFAAASTVSVILMSKPVLSFCAQGNGLLPASEQQRWRSGRWKLAAVLSTWVVEAPVISRMLRPTAFAQVLAGAAAAAAALGCWCFVASEVRCHLPADEARGRWPGERPEGSVLGTALAVLLLLAVLVGAASIDKAMIVQATTTTMVTSTTTPEVAPPPTPSCKIGPGDGVEDDLVAKAMKVASQAPGGADERYGCLMPAERLADGTWVQHFDGSPAFLVSRGLWAGVVQDVQVESVLKRTRGSYSVTAMGGQPLNRLDCRMGELQAWVNASGVIVGLRGRATKQVAPIEVDPYLLDAVLNEMQRRGAPLLPSTAGGSSTQRATSFVGPRGDVVTISKAAVAAARKGGGVTADRLYSLCQAGRVPPQYRPVEP